MQSQRSEFRCRLEGMLESCGLPTEVAADIEDRLTPVTYGKGAVIFLRGAPCDLVFWLLKGFVKLYVPHPDGNRTLVDLARPGDFLGFVHDRDSKGPRHLLEAHALTKCSVGWLPRDQIGPILSKLDRTATIHLLEQLNSAWSAMLERYVWFLGSPFRTRLEIVLDSLGTRFGIYDKRGTLVVLELSHEDLAEMIGSCRPTVSKLINDMIKEGLLARGQRRRLILSPKERTSSVAPSAQSPAYLNGYAKQMVGARDHASGRRSGSYGTMAK
jgi:CRP/FNR family transcriptional regulator